MRSILLKAAILSFILLLVACAPAPANPNPGAPPAGQACTEIGCVSGLTVLFEGEVPPTFTAKFDLPDSASIEITCPDGGTMALCNPDGVFLMESTPAEVTVTITWEGGSVSEKFTPTYNPAHPNGPNCPPACLQGQVTLKLS